MKQITKEQIETIVNQSFKRNTQNIYDRLEENIKAYENNVSVDNESMKPYALHIASMSTAQQVCVDVIKEVLCQLLIEE